MRSVVDAEHELRIQGKGALCLACISAQWVERKLTEPVPLYVACSATLCQPVPVT